jgi:uncharacterized protein
VAKCLQCGKECPPREANPARPFCSPRCKDIDLGRWFDGDYVISRPLFDGGGRLPGGAPLPEDDGSEG